MAVCNSSQQPPKKLPLPPKMFADTLHAIEGEGRGEGQTLPVTEPGPLPEKKIKLNQWMVSGRCS